MYDTIIIGAGSSGLMCAARLVYHGIKSVLLLDSNPKAGKKLAITGNGRCNLTNLSLDKEQFYSDDQAKLSKIIDGFGVSDTIAFFENVLGLKTSSKDELVYPFTFKSSSVIDVLRFYIDSIDIMYDSKVSSVSKKDGLYEVTSLSQTFSGKNLVFATGGLSYSKTGSDGSGFKLMSTLIGKEDFTSFTPSLVQLTSSDRELKNLSGYRFNVDVKLTADGSSHEEKGELLFTDYGVSGICIMQLSRYLVSGRNRLSVDFLVDDDLISNMVKIFSSRDTAGALVGIIPPVLTDIVLKRIGKDKLINDADIGRFLRELHNFTINISGTQGFDNAQVTRGGVKLSSLDASLQSVSSKGLYVCGEAVNVDGPCGGYNLQWAWSSAVVVADSIKRSLV